MRLHWVRHGQAVLPDPRDASTSRVNRLFNQHEDPPLTPLGHSQAAVAAAHFRRAPVEAVYSSTLQRARQTAAATAEALELEVCTTDRITELRPGKLSERTIARIRRLGHGRGAVIEGPLVPALAGLHTRPRRRRWLAWRGPHIPNGAITEMELHPDGRLELRTFAREPATP